MEHSRSEPIYALGSPLGKSALAVVRVSGLGLPEKLYADLSTTRDKRGFFVRRLSFSGFSETCLVLSFPEPLSYTGESMIEIHPHGNPAVLSEVFSWLESLGIREASPGEFSRRAFINNKLSLAEAEGIAMGIEAESKEQLLALEDFRGGSLGKKINKILSLIEQLLVRVESQLDFSDEEDVNEVASEDVFLGIKEANKALGSLIKEYKPFEKDVMKKTITLTGKPNVGKSSLFNCLAGERLAIVSEEAGTTRDVVRKRVVMSGFDVEIQDTAGLRDEASSKIEKEGMLLALSAAKASDLVLHVVDQPSEVKGYAHKPGVVVVLNKCDLHDSVFGGPVVCVSAKTGNGISQLIEKIQETSLRSVPERLVSERIYKRLVGAEGALSLSNKGEDFFETSAQALRESLIELKEIYGTFDNEKILDQIFENFCIGK